MLHDFWNKHSANAYIFIGGLAIVFVIGASGLALLKSGNSRIIENPVVRRMLPTYREIRSWAVSLSNLRYVTHMKRDVGLVSYNLYITPENLNKLNSNLPDTTSLDVVRGQAWLTDKYKKYVPAVVRADGNDYEVEVRYRGDNPNHWTYDKKSWNIKFNKDTRVAGRRIAKLIIPVDRGYFSEMLTIYRAHKLGLATPDARFVTLYVNGKYYGVYYDFEDLDADFLEKNQLPTEASLYITADNKLEGDDQSSAFEGIQWWKKQAQDSLFDFDNYAELNTLFSFLNGGKFAANARQLVDMESFYGSYIIATLAGSNHQGNGGNVRLLFDTTKGKFMFIPWDVSTDNGSFIRQGNDLAQALLADPAIEREFYDRLWGYVHDEDQVADDFKQYDQWYRDIAPAVYADWTKHESNRMFDQQALSARNEFQENIDAAISHIKESNHTVVVSRLSDGLRIDITPRSQSGLSVSGIQIGGLYGEQSALWLDSNHNSVIDDEDERIASGVQRAGDSATAYAFDPVFLPTKKDADGPQATTYAFLLKNLDFNRASYDFKENPVTIDLQNAVTGETVRMQKPLYTDSRFFANLRERALSPDIFIKEHPAFTFRDNAFHIGPGSFVLDTTIIPSGYTLSIAPNSTFYMKEDASLVSYSPIEARGSAVQPIFFQPLDAQTRWGVVGMVGTDSNEQNILEYVRILGGREAVINGTILSGSLSIYHASAQLRHSFISDAKGEDAVTIKYGSATIEDTRWERSFSDALDFDFVQARIVDSTFLESGNDAIDLSGSAVDIVHTIIRGSGDKCVSVGEKSGPVLIYNSSLVACAIGVQSKDLSRATVLNSVIVGNKMGVHAYQKKPVFGPGELLVYNSILWENEITAAAEDGSDITITDSDFPDANGQDRNHSLQPIFIDEDRNNFLLAPSGPEDLKSGGNAELFAKLLGQERQQVPIGLSE